MPLIDSALAFAITMLALSLTCSAFIELIHRAFKMREAGLKYMVREMFDQVLHKYARSSTDTRESFVRSMTANRAPVGLSGASKPKSKLGKIFDAFGSIWGGRSITHLTPNEFMERLGNTEVGKKIKTAVAAAGQDAADAEAKTDAVLKDIALKFDAFGKDAATYFEGRARFLSVAVAIALAFAVHVDAIDLFKTYLQNPNATASVIAQSQAITGQMKSAQAAVEASKKIAAAAAPADQEKPTEPAQPSAPSLEELQQGADKAISDAKKMVKQFTDLGVPFGWSDARIAAADMWLLVWTCKELKDGVKEEHWTLRQECKDDAPKHNGPQLQYKNVWLEIPRTLNVWFCLLLGGFLIGLGAPFWYDAVTGLANISKVLGGGSSSAGAPAASPPVTPANAFNISSTAGETGDEVAKTADNPAAQ
jgi:hypothetical protein